MSQHCCDLMEQHLRGEDNIICYVPKFREYGLPVHDGGTSFLAIDFCPWCGKKLPVQLRDSWFETLEKMGHKDPVVEGYPSQFETDSWWKSKEQA